MALVRPETVEAFAALSGSRIRQFAEAWQQTDSDTSSLSRWNLEDIVEAVMQLKVFAQQQQKLQPGWELLMVWYV
jgi:hypothetical protein